MCIRDSSHSIKAETEGFEPSYRDEPINAFRVRRVTAASLRLQILGVSLRNTYTIIHDILTFVICFFQHLLIIKMSTLNSTFFHVFIVLPFCTIRSLFYCIFSLLGSAIVRLPLLPASHVPYFCSYASCFTSSSNSSPAE